MSSPPSLYRRPRRHVALFAVLGFLVVASGGLLWWRSGRTSHDGETAPLQARSAAVPATSNEIPPAGDTSVPTPPEAAELLQEERPASEGARGGDEVVAAFGKKLEAADAAGDPDAFRRLVGVAVLDPRIPRESRDAWLKKADDLNRRLVFSTAKAKGFGTEDVRKGDSYWKISERLRKDRGLKVTAGLLEAINHVPSNRLRGGESIKIPEEALSLLVDKSDFQIYLLLGGIYTMRFPVGIGREDLTPDGTFVVGGKMAKPVWTDPKTGKSYRFGEPGHLVGSRWIAFFQDGKRTSFGIHGTVDPDSIGHAQSDGCIRMRNEDVEKLFDLVPEGVTVVVRG